MQAASDEEWLVVRLVELLERVGDRRVIDHVFVVAIQRLEFDATNAVVGRVARDFSLSFFISDFRRIDIIGIDLVFVMIVVPILVTRIAAVIDLAGPADIVAVGSKVFVQRGKLGDVLPPVDAVAIDTRRARPLAGHEGGARRIADGRGAVGVGEGDAAGREAVEVGRFDLLLTQIVNPVVQIVDRDEEDVGLARLLSGRRCWKREEQQEQGGDWRDDFHRGAMGRGIDPR